MLAVLMMNGTPTYIFAFMFMVVRRSRRSIHFSEPGCRSKSSVMVPRVQWAKERSCCLRSPVIVRRAQLSFHEPRHRSTSVIPVQRVKLPFIKSNYQPKNQFIIRSVPMQVQSDEGEQKKKLKLTFAAARAVANSPSLCSMPWTPTGAMRTGDL